MIGSTRKLLDFIEKHKLEDYDYQDSGLVDTLLWEVYHNRENLRQYLVYEYYLDDEKSVIWLCDDDDGNNREITEEEALELRK